MPDSKPIDPRWAWEPYRPGAEAPWNLERVGHLHRRAGFGATHAELEQGLQDGPEKTIDALLRGGPGQEEYNRATDELAESIARGNNGVLIRAWWLHRMLYTPHPLQEKLTLFWHNHFATSNAKVNNAEFMLEQYRLMYKHARGNFAELLQEMSKDRAMMVWLDTRGSKKGNPNENYARELMELFSLGIGNYTEQDIREAARAFTGWEIQGGKVVFNSRDHDEGSKSVLGQSGNFKGEDIVRICLEQKAAPRFIVRKLFTFLVSETVPATPELIDPLAERFQKGGYDFGQLVETVLRSNLFFSPQVYRTRIKSPVEFALGIVRGLEGRIGTTALADSLEQLGQNVFNPPSVKGWDGATTWLNGQTLLYRQNLALALTSTEDVQFGRRTDPAVLARKYKVEPDETVNFFVRLFLQGDLASESAMRLNEYYRESQERAVPVYWTREDAQDHRTRTLCHLVLTQPEFQLC
jgi:uncharacterized protein (DUF1800 family)